HLHLSGPRSNLFVRDQRHRSNAVWPMTRLAAPLQDRRNILRESDVAWRRPRLPPNGGWYEENRKNRNEPHEAKWRSARHKRTSDIHSHTSLNHGYFIGTLL